MRPPKDPQERIREILDAAEYLFYTQGYEQTTIQDIAKRIGVAQGTMYYYFKSKSKVLEGILDRKAKDILFVVKQLKKEPLHGYDRLSAIISGILKEVSTGNGAFLSLIYNDQVAPFTNRTLEYMAVVLAQELSDFIGEPGSGKEIQVRQTEAVIFFILETINNLVDVLCDELPPQDVKARMRIGEKIVAAVLGCDERFIRIRLT